MSEAAGPEKYSCFTECSKTPPVTTGRAHLGKEQTLLTHITTAILCGHCREAALTENIV